MRHVKVVRFPFRGAMRRQDISSNRRPDRLMACVLSIAAAAALLPAAGAQDSEFRLTVVSPTAVMESAVVSIQGSRISAVTREGGDPNAIAIDGVMFPGLIDIHNHLTWNVLPNWRPPRLFSNRYEWQDTPEYALNLSGPYGAMMAAGAGCDMNRFGEVKSIVNGGTATVGSLGPGNPGGNACIEGLARNIDYAADVSSSPILNKEPYRNFVFPFELSAEDEQLARTVDPDSADPAKIHAAVVHLAEGVDASARREFRLFRAHHYDRKGVTVIHGVALAPDQLRELAAKEVGLVWSPHSNLILYGRTADVLSAINAKMTVALAPDWSPTGSAGMLEELGIAYRYSLGSLGGGISESNLVQMATINPARLANLDRQLGSIEPGKLADFVIMKRKGKTAYQALLMGGPGDVLLVEIGGVPVYGDRALMRRLLPKSPLEDITVCGEPKALHIVDTVGSDNSWQRLYARLELAMKPLGFAPSSLATCSAKGE